MSSVENVRMKEHVTLTQREQTRQAGPYDHGAGSRERAPHPYSGGLQQGGSSRTRSRQSRSQTGQRYIGPVGDRRGGPGAPIRLNHTHLSELLREREGIDIGRNTEILTDAQVLAVAGRRVRRPDSRGNADTDRRQLPQMAGRRWPPVATAGGRRRYWLCRQCPVLRAGEHPQLLTADAGSDTELRHTGTLLWRLQAHAAVGDRRRSHPVLGARRDRRTADYSHGLHKPKAAWNAPRARSRTDWSRR